MALSSSRCGLISISAIVAPERAGRCSTSPTMFFMNTVEPAPMKVILGCLAMLTSGICSSHVESGSDEPFGVGGLGIGEDLVDGSLLDDLAMLHDDDAMAQRAHHLEVVRNEEVAEAALV